MSDILISQQGAVGRVILNRPHVLNALTYDICIRLDHALIAWADDPSVKMIIIEGAGEKAFCAGGDIAELYHHGKAGNFAYGQQFWRDEYQMNARLGSYPKPILAFVHGFCMGGGVGIAGHASHRIMCQSTQIAMPECAIGLVPDVGGSALLARALGRIGVWMGLTGQRLNCADAIYAGFGDLYIPKEAWPTLIDDLCQTPDLGRLQAAAQSCPTPSTLPQSQALIDRLFAATSVAQICADLAADGSDFAMDALAKILRGSPLSAAVTLALIEALGKAPELKTALEMEYRVTYRAQELMDFQEGVRAMLIDKNRQPKWAHQSPKDVTQTDISNLLAPLGAQTLIFTE